jgi:glycine dehydrogenase
MRPADDPSLAALGGLVPFLPGERSEHVGFFEHRHIGTSSADRATLLAAIGYDSLGSLLDDVVPAGVRDNFVLDLHAVGNERELLAELRALASANRVLTPMIGLGFYDTVLPAVLRRLILENPAWYTSYTPYQAEIAQGRLEALLIFQTMVADLTALPVANASLLDEATAAVEAMFMCQRAVSGRRRFVVDADCFPQTIAVLKTRAEPLDIEIVIADLDDGLPAVEPFGVLVQQPGCSGRVRALRPLVDAAHDAGALAVVACDLLAATIITPPGEDGADIAVGTTQRLGMPLGFGGPHAAFLATTNELERSVPGRIVGLSRDALGNRALQLALQTREQHIRRERATSNICTAEVLPAIVAAMFAVYHGPDGLRSIAERIHALACSFADTLRGFDVAVGPGPIFDTVTATVPGQARAVMEAACERGINIRLVDADTVAVSCDEVTDEQILTDLLGAFGVTRPLRSPPRPDPLAPHRRTSGCLAHPVFSCYRSEVAMTRLLRRLSDLDLALDRSMIPLGSCTMKLNACLEMEPISWTEFVSLHPFAPADQTEGSRRVIEDLSGWLAAITGFEAVSLQPNAGSQGELAGLLAIRAYHRSRGELERDVCLVPTSAHGTNPASARLAGMRIVTVSCDEEGSVDLGDLRAQIAANRDHLSALMITYPSTHGVFEASLPVMCELVHAAGGQVYLDGANLNALIGLARPGALGADASQLNLHKTFCIPHGGGGPGVGPVAVKAHLAPFLPNHPLRPDAGPSSGIGPLSSCPFGSASILTIPWAYIRLLGGEGLARASEAAIVSANYLASALDHDFPVLYKGEHGRIGHECVLDLRPFSRASGIKVDDVAKRLIDYGFHAPTMSFPVAGTLMVEPTESEPFEELVRFVEAMKAIRSEIDEVARASWPAEDNPLVNAPHTAEELAGAWTHPYDRATAAFPMPSLRASTGGSKYWPPVKRIDAAFGDRHPHFVLLDDGPDARNAQ